MDEFKEEVPSAVKTFTRQDTTKFLAEHPHSRFQFLLHTAFNLKHGWRG
jgi:hypothetical protein